MVHQIGFDALGTLPSPIFGDGESGGVPSVELLPYRADALMPPPPNFPDLTKDAMTLLYAATAPKSDEVEEIPEKETALDAPEDLVLGEEKAHEAAFNHALDEAMQCLRMHLHTKVEMGANLSETQAAMVAAEHGLDATACKKPEHSMAIAA